ncbi:MAG: oligosaccharide flippase family protein, partial [Deltaproteobacteria bacterium]|nr:oligosaccharide flippase family protein [Deltaproteobacteria bacterium]
ATFSTEIGIRLLAFTTRIVIVRNLSPSDFGAFSLFMSFSLTLGYLSNLGLPQAIVYFIGKGKAPVEKMVGTYLFLFLCIGLSVVSGSYMLRDFPLRSFLKELPPYYYLPLLLFYFFTLLDAFLQSLIRGLKKFGLFNVRRLLTPVGNLFGVLVILLLSGLTLRSVIIVSLSVNVLLTIILTMKVLSITSFRFDLHWLTIRSLLRYGILSYLQLIVAHLIYQADLYMIAYLLDAQQVAFYSIAVGVATLLWFLPDTIGIVLFPALSSIENENQIHSFSAQVCRNTLLITTLGALGLGLIGKYVIVLFYGVHYLKSVNAMLILLPGIVSMSSYKVLTRNFSSRNRQQVSIIAAGISLLLNIGLNWYWIPKYGIEGAAVASTITYTLAGVILIGKVKMESNLPLRKILLVDKTDIVSYKEIISRVAKKYRT